MTASGPTKWAWVLTLTQHRLGYTCVTWGTHHTFANRSLSLRGLRLAHVPLEGLKAPDLTGLCQLEPLASGSICFHLWHRFVFLFRCSTLYWSNNHRHATAFHLGFAFNPAHLFEFLNDFLEDAQRNFRMSHFSTTKDHSKCDLIAIVKKLLRLVDLRLNIMSVSLGTQPNFLHLHGVLSGLGLLSLLFLIVLISPVVHDLAHGRFCCWRDLNQIQFCVTSEANSIVPGQNAYLLTLRTNNAKRGYSNLPVNTHTRRWRGPTVVTSQERVSGLIALLGLLLVGNLQAHHIAKRL